MSNSVTTVRLAGERKRIVERMALEAGSKCGKILRVSDVVHFLIDRYSNLETIEELAKKNTPKRTFLLRKRRNQNEIENFICIGVNWFKPCSL